MRRILEILAILFAATLSSPAMAIDKAADNWHQWRGPSSNGVASKGSPPTTWDAEKNVRWKVEIPGRGSSSPIVWGDRIYLTTAIDTGRTNEGEVAEKAAAIEEAPAAAEPEGRPGRGFGRRGRGGGGEPKNFYKFTLLCLDRNTGDVVWEKVAREAVPHEGMHETNSYASGSPTTDGQQLYVSFGSHGIYCYDLDGNLKWERDLGDMETRNSFGEGASPTIHEGTLLVPWDHEKDSHLFALDAATGETKWEIDRDEPTTWVTPLVVDAAGRTQVILNGTNRSRSYDIETGETIWECGGQVTNPIATAVTVDGLVFCMTGHRGSAVVAIPLDAKGDVTGAEEVAWKTNQGAPYVPSPLLYGDRLYFTKGNNGVLSCLNAKTGEPLIDQKRLPGVENVYASPVGADGRIYFTGRDGTTVVIPDSSELEILSTNTVGEAVDASPAIVGDEIFIRGEHHLFCIGEK